MPEMKHMDWLTDVVKADVECIREKEHHYKGSWKKRGGVGIFMMLARKWDRLENLCEAFRYDVFAAISAGASQTEGALEQIRDLRRYLILVEAEMVARNQDLNHKSNPEAMGQIVGKATADRGLYHGLKKPPEGPGTPEDGGHHARTMPLDEALKELEDAAK